MITTPKQYKITYRNKDIPDNKELWEEYKKTNSVFLRNKLIELNLGLARKVAHRIHSSHPNLIYEDVEQEAFKALIYCVENFDIDKGYRFATFAYPVLGGRLLNYVRDKVSLIRIPRRFLKTITSFNKNETSVEDYKKAQNDIYICRYVKELIGNENIIYEENKNNYVSKTIVKIETNNLDVLNDLISKKSPNPMEILRMRKLCSKVEINFKIL